MLGRLVALVGGVSPWTRENNFYGGDFVDRLTSVTGLGSGSDHRNGILPGGWWAAEPSLSQPLARAVVLVLAVMFGYGLYLLLAPLPISTDGVCLVILGGAC